MIFEEEVVTVVAVIFDNKSQQVNESENHEVVVRQNIASQLVADIAQWLDINFQLVKRFLKVYKTPLRMEKLELSYV